MRIVRWFFVLVVLLALGAGLAYFFAGRADGPVITINQPSVIGQAGTLDVTVEAPGADLSALTIELAQKGQLVSDSRSRIGSGRVGRQGRRATTRQASDRQKHHPGSRQRPGDGARACVAARAARIEAGGVRSVAGRRGPADAPAHRRRVDASLHQRRRIGNDRLSRLAARCRVRRTRWRRHLSGLLRIECRPQGSRAQGRVLCAALRPEAGDATGSLRARHRRQHGARAIRPSHLSEDVPQQPDSAGRQVSRPRRAGDSAGLAAAEGAGRRPVAGLSQDQQRPSTDEQRDDCLAGAEDGARHPLAGCVSTARRITNRIVLCRFPHLSLRRQRGGPSGASRLRPRQDRQLAGDRRAIAARCSSLPSSASTATRSSSITAWACSRSTGISPRSRSRKATRCRRDRRSAPAARPAWPAAITCTSACW